MANKKDEGDFETNIPWPFRGIDRSTSFGQQPALTTPDSVNVRSHEPATDRLRGASRPGLGRYIAEQVANASVQDIDSILLAIDQTAGTGDAMTNINSGMDTNAVIYSNSDGTILFTSEALESHLTIGVSDEDGYYYVATIQPAFAGIRIRKIGTDFIQAWSVNLTVDMTIASNISGMSVFENVVYLWVTSADAAIDIADPGIYRFDVADGVRLDAGVWITPGDGLATVINVAVPYQALAAGAGLVGVCGKVGGALILQQWRIVDQVLMQSTVIQASFESYPCKLIQDAGSNFYVLTNTTGVAANVLKRVRETGAVTWTITSTGVSGIARDLTFDLAYFLLGIVGDNLFDASGKSFRMVVADTGAYFTSGSSPGGLMTWVAVSGSGDGSWRLRSSDPANDVLKLEHDGITETWTESSGDDSAASYLWIVCQKTNVDPTTE